MDFFFSAFPGFSDSFFEVKNLNIKFGKIAVYDPAVMGQITEYICH